MSLQKWFHNGYPIRTQYMYRYIFILFIVLFLSMELIIQFQIYKHEIAKQEEYLISMASVIKHELPGSFKNILIKDHSLNNPRNEQISIINHELQPKIDRFLPMHPNIEVGLYSLKLKTAVAFGPNFNRAKLQLMTNIPRSFYQTTKPQFCNCFVRSKPILMLGYPIYHKRKLDGYIFINYQLIGVYLELFRWAAFNVFIGLLLIFFTYRLVLYLFNQYKKELETLSKIVTQDLPETGFELSQCTIPEIKPILDLIINQTNELKRTNNSIVTILESITDCFFAVDKQWRFHYLNKEAENLLQCKSEDVIGQVGWELFPRFVETIIYPEFHRAIADQVPIHLELQGVYQDRWIEVRAYPSLEGLSIFCCDITQRKENEKVLAQLATIVESSEDAIISLNLDYLIMSWNAGATKIFGYHEDEVVGKCISILVPPEKMDKHEQITENLSQGLEIDLFEAVLLRKDGKRINVSVKISRIRNQKKEVIGFSAIHRDITEKKKLEEELIKAQKLEALGILAGGITHDFNNILAIIMANVQLAMLMLAQGKDAQKYLDDTIKVTNKAKNLTQQILTFAKGGAPIRTVVSISDLLKEIVNFSLCGSKTKCEFYIQDDLWNAEVDEGQISQVLNNLVLNADQAMPNGGRIEIYAQNINLETADRKLPLIPGDYIKLSIIDHGEGIPDDKITKVFDPFFTTKPKGNGLGLTTSYSIIKRHDGFIDFESIVGKGTTIHLYLPAAPNLLTLAKLEVAANQIEGVGEAKILLMDDDEIILQSIGEMLREFGCKVTVARDGNEAIELYKQAKNMRNPFDVVIMDLTIPGGMGGKEAIKQLLIIDSKIKAVVSSGYSTDPIMANYQEYGFCGVLVKPYQSAELSNLLSKIIS